jgi:hypothetical protein
MFNISKSTLLRWEREGSIARAQRMPNSDQRFYSQDEIKAIGRNMEPKLRQQFARAYEDEDIPLIQQAHEALYLWKFLIDKPGSFEELESIKLSAPTLRKLQRIGLERYEPDEPQYARLLSIMAEKSRALCQA